MKKHLQGLLAGILILGTVTSCHPETSADTADDAGSLPYDEHCQRRADGGSTAAGAC